MRGVKEWFGSCLTVESVKAAYRTHAKENHPDLGGDTATMQELNAAYLLALESLNGQTSHDETGREHTYRYDEAREQEIMDKLHELLRDLPAGVDLALIGLWLWISGTRKEDTATRATLKAAGCMWHSKRGVWYWRPSSMKHYGKRSRGSLSDLANRYGCRTFTAGGANEDNGPARGQLALAV